MVDVAKLVFDFDATSATTAERQIDSLEKTAGRLEQTAKRSNGAFSGGAFDQARNSAGAFEKSMNNLVGVYGQARDALGRYTAVDGSFRLSQEATAKVLLQNAKTVEAYARQQEQAAKAAARAAAEAERERRSEMDATAAMLIRNAKLQGDLARQQEQAAATTASYAAKVAGLKAQLDPFAAVQLKLAQNTKLLDDAMAHGAITGTQYDEMLSRVTRSALADVQAIEGLNNAHATATGSSRTLNYAMLNLSRQASDLGVGFAAAATSGKPLQMVVMTLIQQGPQVVDVFADLRAQGVGVKTALSEMAVSARALLVTFGPWIAGLAVVGAGVWYFIDAHQKQAEAIKSLNKDLKEQNKELGALSPLILDSGNSADLAADGLKNFDQWLRTSNVSLSEQNRLLRENALNKLNDKAMEAAEKYSQAQKAFDKINKSGPAMASSAAPGGFGVVAPAKATDPKNNPFYKEAAENLRIAKQSYDAINEYRNKAYLAPEKAFAAQEQAASKATTATKNHTAAIKANEVAIVGLGDNTFEFTRDLERQVAAMGQSKETQMELAYQTARLGATTDDQRERLDRAYDAWKAQNRVLKDAEKVQKEVDAQQRDNIKTVHDANKGLTEHKRTLEEVAWTYERAFRSAGDFFGAVASGDVGGSIGGLSNLLKDASKLTGADSGIGKMLGKAGAFLGPVGAAVDAVTSVLGVIGAKSAEKAQAKLDALARGVDDLRTANVTSSASIKGALDEANKAWNADLEYSSQMVTSLRSIDTQIGSLAVAVSNSITTGNLLSTSGLGLGTSGSGAGGLFGAVGALLFGNTKTSTQLLDQGLAFAPGTYAQGVTGSTYADLATTKTKSLLGVAYSTKVSNSTVSGALSGDLLAQVNAVIKSLGDGVLSAASVFGLEAAKAAESALGSAVVDLGKLSLKDLKPDEIAAVLQATFDKVGDQLASAGVPGLDKLGQVGEGAFETLTRVAREYQVVDVALASLGKTFGQVGLESLAARDNLVQLLGGVEEFSSRTSFFATNFLTDAERLAPIQKAVNDNLAAYGLSAASTRDQFKQLVLAQDLTTESGRNAYAALLNIAPAFDKVATASEAVAKAEADLNKARTDAAAEQERLAKEAADELARTYQEANVGLMRQLMAMDDAVLGTTSARDAARADELAKLDETGRKLQTIIWARQDEAEVIAKQQAATEAATAAAEESARKTAELLKQRTDLENQLLVALGMTALATERQRAAMLEGLDPSLRGYQTLLYGVEDATAAVTAAESALADARSAASQAYEREASALQATIDKFKSFSASLKSFRGSLDTGGLAMNDPMTQYARTKADFERVAGLAASGNEEALGSLQGVSEAYLEASKNAQATNVGYFKDLAAVKRATEAAQKYADQQVDQGTAQLNALQSQVSALGILNQSTLSVGQAVTNVAAAIDALARATSAKSAADAAAKQALSSAGVIPKATESIAIAANDNADLAAAKAIYLSATGGISSELFNRYVGSNPFATFNRLGYEGDPEALRKKYGFATGGSFTVGGSGPPDSQVFPLHLSPGEMVNVSRPGEGGNAELVAELRALRQEVAELKAAQIQTTINTGRQVRLAERWDGDGLPETRSVA